jgi:hypothetical protein
MWSLLKALIGPQHPKSPVNHYRIGRRFDPGAPGDVFISDLGLPIIMFNGRARVAGSLSKFQPPQIWFPAQQGIQGVGGVQAGQYVGQRLVDPAQLNTEPGE